MKNGTAIFAALGVVFGGYAAFADEHEGKCFDKSTLIYVDCPEEAAVVEDHAAVKSELRLDLGLGGGGVRTDVDSNDGLDGGIIRGIGDLRGNIALYSGLAAQIDLGGEYDFNSQDHRTFTQDYTGSGVAAAHVNWRNESFLIGAFGGVGHIAIEDDDDERGYIYGAEAQYHLGAFTLYGQGGGFDSSEIDDETMSDAYFGRGVVRYYADPNLMFAGEFQYGIGKNTETSPSVPNDIEVFGWGAEIRYRGLFDNADIFARYSGMDASSPGNAGAATESLTEHLGFLGVSISLGDDAPSTLMDSNRRGVATDVSRDMFRAAGYSTDIIDN